MIYDCFTFFNEIDLLRLRMNILGEHVDRFVICEADRTFRGDAKPYIFEKLRHEFSEWEDKIIYLKCSLDRDDNPWNLESAQRNYISEALGGLRGGSLIFISDVDEIWDPKKLQQIESESFLKPVKLQQNLYYYKLNLHVDLKWFGTVAVRKFDLNTPQALRSMGDRPRIENAGWHFSYLGSPSQISSKISAFSHSELDIPKYNNKVSIQDSINTGKDLFGRNLDISRVDIDHTFPDYILNNQEELKVWIA